MRCLLPRYAIFIRCGAAGAFTRYLYACHAYFACRYYAMLPYCLWRRGCCLLYAAHITYDSDAAATPAPLLIIFRCRHADTLLLR